ncbi:hypothetical protein GGS23DRAFT_353650 [Durotheca rogersii]|uniref:uncharacterized protein n=1 Tax=Durotheca rogersii TaxID=419775 RepID=UPI00222107C4|nr:uncharacterized protein GGS23DRAFT_353650 [Durotheca rogersii]KAI5865757.1 hypothetical protein GGS23DRAFT_353650 [Durotheca rogersii]
MLFQQRSRRGRIWGRRPTASGTGPGSTGCCVPIRFSVCRQFSSQATQRRARPGWLDLRPNEEMAGPLEDGESAGGRPVLGNPNTIMQAAVLLELGAMERPREHIVVRSWAREAWRVADDEWREAQVGKTGIFLEDVPIPRRITNPLRVWGEPPPRGPG